MSAEPRMVAGRYRLDERIGAGGMGVVWRAHDELLHRTVAVKQLVLGPGLTPEAAEEGRARAMREGRIAARLQHPHAINVFDVALGPDLEGGQDAQPWLVMEYLPSRSLADVLAEGPLPAREVARIGRQVADALAAAHREGIVHRDVKPGNVLIGQNGTVKITDFGIARASWDETVTRTGVLTGTPAFFAPEVARGEAPDPASDVFSLGSTLYAAVEGVPPFGHDDNTLALLRSVADGDVRPQVTEGPLSELIMKMLRYDPALRPVMSVTRDVLGRIAAKESRTPTTSALPAGSDTSPDPRTPRAVPPRATAVERAPDVAKMPAPTDDEPAAPESVPSAVEVVPEARQAQPVADVRTEDPPPPRTGTPGPRWWQRRRVLAGLVVALLLTIAALVVVLNLDQGDNPSTTADEQTSTSAAQTETAPTSPEVTTTSAQPLTTTPAAPAAPGPEDFEQAVRDYYSLLPDQLDAAYAYLGPDVQEQSNGRDGFERFWTQYSDVGTENVQANGTTVTLTIVYTELDGTVFREPYTLTMGTGEDGRILIMSSAYGGPG